MLSGFIMSQVRVHKYKILCTKMSTDNIIHFFIECTHAYAMSH